VPLGSLPDEMVAAIGSAYAGLVLLDALAAQAIMIPLLAMFRVGLFSCMFGCVATIYGFGSFGRLSGIILVTGAVSSVASVPLVAVSLLAV
jgi:hypothetical protein